MDNVLELTIRLKELGIERYKKVGTFSDDYVENGLGGFYLWSIPSSFTWLRENGYIYRLHPNGSDMEIKIYKKGDSRPRGRLWVCIAFISVKAGWELSGLLKCMVQIEEQRGNDN